MDIKQTLCRFQSEIYETLDCLFYDKGILGDSDTHTDQWLNGGSTMTAQSDGTLISATALSTNWANKKGTSSSEFDYTGKVAVEFDLVETTDDYIQVQFYDGANLLYGTVGSNQIGHIKVVLDGNKATPYYNGVKGTDWTGQAMVNPFRVGFRVHANLSMKFKEFKIYPI